MKYLLIFITLFLVAIPANAQTKYKNGVDKSIDYYGYVFDDDPLHAKGFSVQGHMLRVRPKKARATLIRPRTNFVPEILKSAEDI